MIITNSESTYGTCHFELMAIFDVHSHDNLDDLMNANSAWRKFSISFITIRLPTFSDMKGEGQFAIFSPLDEINENWAADNPECQYFKDLKKSNPKARLPKKMPTGCSRKDWDKFLAKYPFMKPIKEFHSVEELKEFYLTHSYKQTSPKL